MAAINTLLTLSQLSSSTTQQLIALNLLKLAGGLKPRHRGPSPTPPGPPQPGLHGCKLCGKVFPSYQALGGHKSSHRRPVGPADSRAVSSSLRWSGGSVRGKHQCSVCLRRFGSGQALGGHKRLHYWEGPVEVSTPSVVNAVKRNFDLNLPAPLVETEELVCPLPAKKIRLSH